MTPRQMVRAVKKLAGEWKYDVVTIGYPGVVQRGQPGEEPYNIAPGWVGFDFEEAFGCPVRVINDAAMQALGCYEGGVMLFLGLGTGVGSALIKDGTLVPLELGDLCYKNATYEDYMGLRGLKRFGTKKWRRHVEYGVACLIAAFKPDDVVLGGGNAKKLKPVPAGCRLGDNADAFKGGFRVWSGRIVRS